MIKNTTRPFLIFALIILLIHAALAEFGLLKQYFVPFWWLIYAVLIPISFSGLFYIAKRYVKTQKIQTIGKNYILYTLIKIILSLAVLIPWLIHKDETSKPMVAQFFIVFFPFLLVETILLVKLLNSPLDEKLKNEENQ